MSVAPTVIQSGANPLFKELAVLASSASRRREQQRMLLDGVHLVEAFAAAGGLAEVIVASDRGLRTAQVRHAFEQVPARRKVILDDRLFTRVATVETPVGIMAVAARPETPASVDEQWTDGVVLDGIQDTGNVGTILRTAWAAGVRDMIVGPGCADPWSPKVLRAGMGAHFGLRIFEGLALPEVAHRARGQVIAAAAEGAADLYSTDLRGPVLWIFGAEGQGVSAPLLAAANLRVRIPMAPGVESLNVAQAAAVCLFEQRRQRMGADR